MSLETCEIAPGHAITRLIRGGWQLAGGHGAIENERAIEDLVATFDAGVTTFDCADIYTGVEELYGALRERLRGSRGQEAARRLRVHTKLVPDLAILPTIRRGDVEAIVDRSLGRLRLDRLDLVQFHWWDYAAPRWLEAMGWLDDLRRAGKVWLIGGTNFDTIHVERNSVSGHIARLNASSVFGPRPTPGKRLRKALQISRRRFALLRHGGGRIPVRPVARYT